MKNITELQRYVENMRKEFSLMKKNSHRLNENIYALTTVIDIILNDLSEKKILSVPYETIKNKLN